MVLRVHVAGVMGVGRGEDRWGQVSAGEIGESRAVVLVQANHARRRVHAEVGVVEEEGERARQLRLLVDHLGEGGKG